MKIATTLVLMTNLFFINNSLSKESALEQCELHIKKSQYTQAISASQHAKTADLLLCQGRAHSALQQFETAQKIFEQALAAQPKGLDLISAHILLGNVLIAKSLWSEAISHYEDAVVVAEAERLTRYVSIANTFKGEAYAKQGQYEQALEVYQGVEKLAMNDNERAVSYSHIAMAYQELNQLDKAIEYQLKTVLMQKKSGTPDDYAEAGLTLGQLFHAQKDFASADKTYQRLWQYAKDNGGDYYVAKSSIYWAKTKRAMGDTATTKQLLEDAKKIAQRLNATELILLLK